MQRRSPASQDTYAGMLDDVVWRYPWRGQLDAAALDLLLARHFLFGGRLLINDGYFIAQPTLLAALANPQSVLNQLLVHGHAAVLSTRRPTRASIVDRARAGVAAHALVVESPTWPQMAEMLDRIDSLSGEPVAWPSRHLTPGFIALARRWASLQNGALGSFAREIRAQLEADLRAPRTKWEREAASQRAAGRLQPADHAAVMHAANQIYHLNFAAALAISTGEAVSAYTFLDTTLCNLLGADIDAIRVEVHAEPSLTIAARHVGALVDRVLSDPACMDARARYLERWPSQPYAQVYSKALRSFAEPGDIELVPPRLFDCTRQTLHTWGADARQHGPASVLIEPQFSRALLGEGAMFRQE